MKGNSYWRHTHFPLNHDHGRKRASFLHLKDVKVWYLHSIHEFTSQVFHISEASWWLNQPIWRICCLVKLDHFPNFGGEDSKKCLKPPASQCMTYLPTFTINFRNVSLLKKHKVKVEINIPKMKVWEKVLNCVSLRIIGSSNGRVNEPILQGGIGPQNDTSVRRSGYTG